MTITQEELNRLGTKYNLQITRSYQNVFCLYSPKNNTSCMVGPHFDLMYLQGKYRKYVIYDLTPLSLTLCIENLLKENKL